MDKDLQDAIEFEQRVAQYLAEHGTDDVPCAHGMEIFCPHPPFKNKGCGSWCRLRDARLAVEQEMERGESCSKVSVRPCPACGNSDVRVITIDMTSHVECMCTGCWLSGPYAETEAGAIEKWNSLSDPALQGTRGLSIEEQANVLAYVCEKTDMCPAADFLDIDCPWHVALCRQVDPCYWKDFLMTRKPTEK